MVVIRGSDRATMTPRSLRASGPAAPILGACNTRCLCVVNDSIRAVSMDRTLECATRQLTESRHATQCATVFRKCARGRPAVVDFTIFRSLNTSILGFHKLPVRLIIRASKWTLDTLFH